MPKKRKVPVVRAWYDKGDDATFLKVGSCWFQHTWLIHGSVAVEQWEDSWSSVGWMHDRCMELHEREARRLNQQRLKAMKGRKP